MSGLLDVVIPRSAADFYALVTALTTIVLARVAFVGLGSIKLTKTDMDQRELRLQRTTAISQVKDFADTIVPAHTKWVKELEARQPPVEPFAPPHGFIFGVKERQNLQSARQWNSRASSDSTREAIFKLNELEAWGMFFDEGLAEERIAEGPCREAYCKMVESYYPVLLGLRNAPSGSGPFTSTVLRYQRWSPRLPPREADAERIEGTQIIQGRLHDG
jgi:hypothetical protein